MNKGILLFFITVTFLTQGISAQNEDCDTIRTFPWCEGFDYVSHPCWLFIDNDSNGHNWTIGDIYPYDGVNCLVGNISRDLEDNWAISPAIVTPDNGISLKLTWMVYAHPNYAETYEVLVGTGDSDDISSFDSIFGETLSGGYFEREITLPQYSGAVIHVAFRHRSQFQNFICIDNMCISTTGDEPYNPVTVSIDSPDSAFVDELVSFSALTENAERIEWRLEGAETTEATGRSVTTSWSTAGNYTVSVTASGRGSTATDSKTITILERPGTENIDSKETSVAIFPNPTNSTTTVIGRGIKEIVIISPEGREIKSITPAAPAERVDVDMSPLPDGAYLMRVITEEGSSTLTIIKK